MRRVLNEECAPPRVPVRLDIQANGFPIAIFTTQQIETWGFPEEWGFRDAYQVVERQRIGLTHEQEARLARIAARPVHRYSRTERFRTILLHLMGMYGQVPPSVVEACEDAEGWEDIRCILKSGGWSLYYTRIPIIMRAIGLTPPTRGNGDCFAKILAQFADLDAAWPSVRAELGRTYFPNLRYCAMRLMNMNGITHLDGVPMLRTAKKCESVGAIFEHMLTFIQAQEIEGWLEDDGSSGSEPTGSNTSLLTA